MSKLNKKEHYRMRTHLVHGNHDRKRWDFDHHIVPPMSASSAYRLGSVHRGAQGFVEFASEEADISGHIPIYIYDRPIHDQCERVLSEQQ